MGIIEKIKEIEVEMYRTHKNKGTGSFIIHTFAYFVALVAMAQPLMCTYLEVVIHSIRLPKQSTVGDILNDLKTKIPEEEKNLGPHDRLIHVYHFTKDPSQNQTQVQNFGEPFFLIIHEGETLAEVKVRIQKKLQVPEEEFSKRRDVYGAWEQYLGLEHSDSAPKRAYSANQAQEPNIYRHYVAAESPSEMVGPHRL
ncbi:hypothetical protein Syun_016810 [Stephania yunnanensis]|uniref:ubiquitinyl hydrolase 1 n=1 Tax=Stephania yunnanensis TaxID=152371 RepID=A0AAP0J812_9MAGN